jgi:hypothetical protein
VGANSIRGVESGDTANVDVAGFDIEAVEFFRSKPKSVAFAIIV